MCTAVTSGRGPRAPLRACSSRHLSLRSSQTSQAASWPAGSAPGPPSSMTWWPRQPKSSPADGTGGELIAPIPSKVSVSRHVLGRRSSHRMAPLGSGHDGASRRSAPALRPGTYRHTVPVEGCSARGGERLPMGPVVVPAEQQIGRWAGAGRGHDDHDRGPARAAAGVISPPQGRTPVDQAVGMPQAAAVGWGVHPGTVTMWKHRRHTLSVSAAPGAGQRPCSC